MRRKNLRSARRLVLLSSDPRSKNIEPPITMARTKTMKGRKKTSSRKSRPSSRGRSRSSGGRSARGKGRKKTAQSSSRINKKTRGRVRGRRMISNVRRGGRGREQNRNKEEEQREATPQESEEREPQPEMIGKEDARGTIQNVAERNGDEKQDIPHLAERSPKEKIIVYIRGIIFPITGSSASSVPVQGFLELAPGLTITNEVRFSARAGRFLRPRRKSARSFMKF